MDSPFEETPAASPDQKEPVLAFLVMLTGAHPGARHRLGESALIGRAATADLRLEGRDVSRHHARVSRHSSGHYCVEDLGSRHGVRVNGLPVAGPTPLALGDRIGIGSEGLLLFTQHDRLEQQLLHAQRMESLGRLAGGIAHDFNNLIGAVVTNLSYLGAKADETTLGSEDVQQTLQDCRSALDRAGDLTRQLLGFARRGRYAPSNVDLDDIAQQVLRLVGHSKNGGGVTLDVTPGLKVHADAAQLHQVLMNVVLNALDAVGSGGQVQVKAHMAQPSDRVAMGVAPSSEPQVVLRISDDGAGMDEETRRRACEPFFTTKELGQGTGLGLASTYGIVSHHGGALHIESEVGQGTTVHILLPGADAHKVDQGLSTDAFSESPEAQTLVVVDDDALVRGSAARYLRHVGYRVHEAADGAQAVALAGELEPDLVMLDMNMPGMDGAQTFEVLRSTRPGLPILLTTGETSEGGAATLLQRDKVRLLSKPYDVADLTRYLRALLEA